MDYRIVYVGAQTIFGIMFLTLLYLRHANERARRLDKLDALYCLFLITIILDAIWMLINGKPEFRNVHVALHVVYLSTMACTGCLWLFYMLDFFPAKNMKLRKYRFVLVIPVLITIVLIFCSIKTSWMFVVDENGLYIRGDYHIYTILLNYSYMLLGSYVALRCRKEALLTMDKRRFGVAALFPVPVLILSAAQMILPPGLPAMQGGVLVALLLLYGTSQNVLITRDHLTDLPNRFAFEQDLLNRINRYKAGGPEHLYVFAGDLDRFKRINDTHGHPVGDTALRLTAKTLQQVFRAYSAVVFRTGGDEFIMTAETDQVLDVDKIRQELNSALAAVEAPEHVQLSMSLGMQEYDGSMNLRTLIEEADRKLYDSKRLMQ